MVWSDGGLGCVPHPLETPPDATRFSTLLAILLDARVPESDAVSLAADCAANRAFKRRAETVITNLQQGQRLTEAVQAVDDSGEFRWRLTNAVHAEGPASCAP
jgi:hypothetical protein